MLQAEVPASKSVVTEEVQHPGAEIMGKNTNGQGFPTLWAPFRSGWVFRTADSTAKPGTVLHFSYITLAMPDVTYGGIYASGFMDYVDLGDKGLVCISNRCASESACVQLRRLRKAMIAARARSPPRFLREHLHLHGLTASDLAGLSTDWPGFR